MPIPTRLILRRNPQVAPRDMQLETPVEVVVHRGVAYKFEMFAADGVTRLHYAVSTHHTAETLDLATAPAP